MGGSLGRYQVILLVCLCLSLLVGAATNPGFRELPTDGNDQNDAISTSLLLSLFNFWTFVAAGGTHVSQCETARCGFGELFFVSYNGIPGTPSCSETCTAFPIWGQCGVCSTNDTPTMSPVPLTTFLTGLKSDIPPIVATAPDPTISVTVTLPTTSPVPVHEVPVPSSPVPHSITAPVFHGASSIARSARSNNFDNSLQYQSQQVCGIPKVCTKTMMT